MNDTKEKDELKAEYRLYFSQLQSSPDDLDVHNRFAEVCCELGRFEESRRSLYYILERKPNDVAALISMGVVNASEGRSVQAEESYRKALHLQPNSTVALFNLGVTRQETGDYLSAEAYYRQVLALDPSYPRIRSALISVLSRAEKYHELVDVLTEVPQDLRDIYYYECLGYAFFHLSRYPAAIETYSMVLTLDSGNVEALRWIAYAYWELDQEVEAEKYFREYFQAALVQHGSLGAIPEIAELLEEIQLDGRFTKIVEWLSSIRAH